MEFLERYLYPLFLTLLVEVPLARLLSQRKDLAFFLEVIGLNILTNTTLNLVINLAVPTASDPTKAYVLALIVGELVVYLVEFLVYAFLLKKDWKEALLVSVVANTVSLSFGLVINNYILPLDGAYPIVILVVSILLLLEEIAYFTWFLLGYLKKSKDETIPHK